MFFQTLIIFFDFLLSQSLCLALCFGFNLLFVGLFLFCYADLFFNGINIHGDTLLRFFELFPKCFRMASQIDS